MQASRGQSTRARVRSRGAAYTAARMGLLESGNVKVQVTNLNDLTIEIDKGN